MNLHVIPNWLIAALGIGFYAFAYVTAMPLDTILWRSQLCILSFIAFFGIRLLHRGLGAGVAKLLSVSFLWLDLGGGLIFLVVSMSLAGFYGLLTKHFTGSENVPFLPFAIITIGLMGGMVAFESSLKAENASLSEQLAE